MQVPRIRRNADGYYYTYHMIYVFLSEPFLDGTVPMVLDCIISSEI